MLMARGQHGHMSSARAARRRRIRQSIAAGSVALFAAAWGVIAVAGKGASGSAATAATPATASPAVASPAAPATADDSGAYDQGTASQDAAPTVRSGQS